MSHYRAGRDVEHRNREHIEADGYQVTRAAGSKGKLDLIAYKPGELLFAQSKLAEAGLSAADWNRLIELASWVGAVPILAVRDTKLGCQEFHASAKCGTRLYRLTGPYLPRKAFALQPAEPFVTDRLAEAQAVPA